MKDKETERLGKLIEMAKRGTENEKKIAIKFVKRLCKKHDLIFKEVMSKTKLKEFELEYKKNNLKDLAFHIYARYGVVNDKSYKSGGFTHRNFIWYKTTLSKHIEILNAFDILSKIFVKEQKLIKDSFKLAFMQKHKLFHYVKNKKEKKLTEEELKKNRIANSIQYNLQSVEIMKRLNEPLGVSKK